MQGSLILFPGSFTPCLSYQIVPVDPTGFDGEYLYLTLPGICAVIGKSHHAKLDSTTCSHAYLVDVVRHEALNTFQKHLPR